MSDGLDIKEFLSGFLVEADEHLGAASRNLLSADAALKTGQQPARQVRELFRSLHTMKGLAAMVGVDPVVDLAHEMETVLREADRAGGRLAPEAVDVLLRGVRAIEERVAALGRGEPVAAAPRDLVDALAGLREVRPSAAPAAPQIELDGELAARLSPAEMEQIASAARAGQTVYSIDFRPSPERMAQGISITSVRERLGAVGEIVKVIPRSVPAGPEAPGGLAFAIVFCTTRPVSDASAASGLPATDFRDVAVASSPELPPQPQDVGDEDLTPAQRRTLVRVDVARLDSALEKLSALIVTRHRLARALANLAASGADVRELQQIVSETARQLRDLRSSIMTARMVPVAEVLERVPLIVRGLSRSTGKPLNLELELGDAEVDKAVGERLFPAIVHLIRNAVDHGIESLADRQQAGKPPEGRIRVSCLQRSSAQLELRISDDGRGIDAERVAQKAGVQVPKDAAELLALITRPGLSTRAEADRTSGRGMGMDIVRKVVEDQLAGDLELSTQKGVGSTFILRVPLSITIVDAFTFAVGEERFAIPVSAVEEIVEVDPARVLQGPSPAAGKVLRQVLERRGEALTLVSLASLFSRSQADVEVRKALVIRRNGEPIAFGVSKMLGQQEIVVRPLEDPLVRVAGVAGATDLGDGRPTLVLDLSALAPSGRKVREAREIT